ncbi:hypothetical protein K438DRAFT_1791151 [Mycena galopus ATCC 62051]|nr:hypothetical protein K438DRAFT_1791151 [Mycena galopus ATCC 62051]
MGPTTFTFIFLEHPTTPQGGSCLPPSYSQGKLQSFSTHGKGKGSKTTTGRTLLLVKGKQQGGKPGTKESRQEEGSADTLAQKPHHGAALRVSGLRWCVIIGGAVTASGRPLAQTPVSSSRSTFNQIRLRSSAGFIQVGGTRSNWVQVVVFRFDEFKVSHRCESASCSSNTVICCSAGYNTVIRPSEYRACIGGRTPSRFSEVNRPTLHLAHFPLTPRGQCSTRRSPSAGHIGIKTKTVLLPLSPTASPADADASTAAAAPAVTTATTETESTSSTSTTSSTTDGTTDTTSTLTATATSTSTTSTSVPAPPPAPPANTDANTATAVAQGQSAAPAQTQAQAQAQTQNPALPPAATPAAAAAAGAGTDTDTDTNAAPPIGTSTSTPAAQATANPNANTNATGAAPAVNANGAAAPAVTAAAGVNAPAAAPAAAATDSATASAASSTTDDSAVATDGSNNTGAPPAATAGTDSQTLTTATGASAAVPTISPSGTGSGSGSGVANESSSTNSSFLAKPAFIGALAAIGVLLALTILFLVLRCRRRRARARAYGHKLDAEMDAAFRSTLANEKALDVGGELSRAQRQSALSTASYMHTLPPLAHAGAPEQEPQYNFFAQQGPYSAAPDHTHATPYASRRGSAYLTSPPMSANTDASGGREPDADEPAFEMVTPAVGVAVSPQAYPSAGPARAELHRRPTVTVPQPRAYPAQEHAHAHRSGLATRPSLTAVIHLSRPGSPANPFADGAGAGAEEEEKEQGRAMTEIPLSPAGAYPNPYDAFAAAMEDSGVALLSAEGQ